MFRAKSSGESLSCLFVLLAFLSTLSPAVSVAAEKSPVDLRQHPTGGKTPIEVSDPAKVPTPNLRALTR